MHVISKSFAASITRALLAPARRFRRNQKGAATVEFLLIFVPFVAFLFAIIETAIVFFAGQVLETAVADSARLILTGQAQSGGFNQASFKNAVCARVSALFDCASKMYIDVRTYSDFSAISMTSPLDSNGNIVNNFVYQPGGPGQIVVVRLMYPWPNYVTIWNPALSNMAGNNRLLIATAAFRNEPY